MRSTCVMVVPCYNEDEVIGLFAEEMKKIVEGLKGNDYNTDLKVLFVNDGSRDKTLFMMEEISKSHESFGYINLSRNYGKEAAMLAGLETAYEMKADYIGVMDVDLQDPPEMIYEMISVLNDDDDKDCAAVKRTTRKGEPPIRSAFARTFYKIMNRISNTVMEDGARDFRIMRNKMVYSILQLKDKCRFSKGIFGYVGYNFHWFDYENIERAAGETKWSFYKLSLYALDGITSFTEEPLRFASIGMGVYGVLLLFLHMVYIVLLTIYQSLSLWVVIAGDYFKDGILFIFLSIAGMYLVRMSKETKDRPVYIIKKAKLPK